MALFFGQVHARLWFRVTALSEHNSN